MKVVVVTAFPAQIDRPRGGVESVSVTLATALAETRELAVHVVTTDRSVASVQVSEIRGLRVHRLPWTARRLLSGIAGADGRAVRAYVKDLAPDVVHAHDTYGLMLAQLDAPRVMTIHGFIHADTALAGERWARLRARWWRRLEERAWASFPHLISISPYVRERISSIATGVIHDIENPIGLSFFDGSQADDGQTLFCAATISPRKNTLALIDALAVLRKRVPTARVRLAGPQVSDYTARVRQRITDLGLDDAVTLLPPLDTQGVRAELSRASVVVLLSKEENAPLAIEEAMAAGVPVVASNRCGMPYLVNDGETGFLVNPNDIADVADSLESLLGSADLRRRMGARARLAARERFHPARVAERTCAVYARAAARGRAT